MTPKKKGLRLARSKFLGAVFVSGWSTKEGDFIKSFDFLTSLLSGQDQRRASWPHTKGAHSRQREIFKKIHFFGF